MSFLDVLELAGKDKIVADHLDFLGSSNILYQPLTTETPPVTVLPDITFVNDEAESTKQQPLLSVGQPKRISKLGTKTNRESSPDFAMYDDYFGSVTHKNDPFATERAAYLEMHDILVQKHFGQFVAIYGSELVDSDDDPEALIKRIRVDYGKSGVFIQKISNKPERIIRLRLPHRIKA